MCGYNEGYEPGLITNDAPGTQWHIASYDGEPRSATILTFFCLAPREWRAGTRAGGLVPAVRRLLPLLSESETAASRACGCHRNRWKLIFSLYLEFIRKRMERTPPPSPYTPLRRPEIAAKSVSQSES